MLAMMAALHACHGQPVRHVGSNDDAGGLHVEQRQTNGFDAMGRYRAYLAGIGYAQPGDRIVEVRRLDLGSVRFFAFKDGGDLHLRFKATVTGNGIVTPGAHAEDDWLGLVSSSPDASAVAERIAWLETDESASGQMTPRPPVTLLSPDHRPAGPIDPAELSLVTVPELTRSPDGAATLTAWFLPSGEWTLVRWSVTARPGVPAVIAKAKATDLLAAQSGGPEAAAATASVRARRLLATGTGDERLWALLHVQETADRGAIPEVAALLADGSAIPETRVLASKALADLGGRSAAAPLGAALRADPADDVRRACAQQLGRLQGAEAIQALAGAATGERDVSVRVEIVHALSAQGFPARKALERIAHDDADASVRDLAHAYAAGRPEH